MLDRFQGISCTLESGIGAPTGFWIESHSRAVTSTTVVVLGIGSSTMPRKTNHGSIQRRSIPALIHVRLNHVLDGIANLDNVHSRLLLGKYLRWRSVQSKGTRRHDGGCHHFLYSKGIEESK